MTHRHLRVGRMLALLSLALALPLVTACGRSERRTATMSADHDSHESSEAPKDSATLRADSVARTRYALLEPGQLGTVVADVVQGWKGPGDQPFSVTLRTMKPKTALFRHFGTVTMLTSMRERTPDLDQYPCTSCHLGRGTVLKDERKPDAHANLKASHPVQIGGLCATCHSAANVEQLTLKTGEHVSLDHTYRVCAQCHFQQVEQWAGGAHGKRLDGWAGRRVVMGCSDCHDPHKPAIGSRTPFRAPHIAPIRGAR